MCFNKGELINTVVCQFKKVKTAFSFERDEGSECRRLDPLHIKKMHHLCKIHKFIHLPYIIWLGKCQHTCNRQQTYSLVPVICLCMMPLHNNLTAANMSPVFMKIVLAHNRSYSCESLSPYYSCQSVSIFCKNSVAK